VTFYIFVFDNWKKKKKEKNPKIRDANPQRDRSGISLNRDL